MRTLFGVYYDNIISPRRDQDKVRMRNGIALAARHANLVWHEWNCPIEGPNGFDNHNKYIAKNRVIIKDSNPAGKSFLRG
jgi:hypothetical protein